MSLLFFLTTLDYKQIWGNHFVQQYHLCNLTLKWSWLIASDLSIYLSKWGKDEINLETGNTSYMFHILFCKISVNNGWLYFILRQSQGHSEDTISLTYYCEVQKLPILHEGGMIEHGLNPRPNSTLLSHLFTLEKKNSLNFHHVSVTSALKVGSAFII